MTNFGAEGIAGVRRTGANVSATPNQAATVGERRTTRNQSATRPNGWFGYALFPMVCAAVLPYVFFRWKKWL